MKIIVFGGDGFCGWPTALRLSSSGHDVHIVDNLSRRSIDNKLSSGSLTEIYSIKERIDVANSVIGNITYQNFDVSKDVGELRC